MQNKVIDKYIDSKLDEILQFISDKTGLTIETIKSERRFKAIIVARACYYYIAKNTTAATQKHIGSKVNQTYAVVINGLCKVSLNKDVKQYANELLELYNKK